MRKVRHLLGGGLPLLALYLLLLIGGLTVLAVFLPKLFAPLAALERALSLLAALIIASSALPAQSKTRRLLLLFLPWLGLALCTLYLPKPVHKPPQRGNFFEDGVSNAVAALALEGCRLGACRAEGVEYFRTGREMSERLFSDLASARREILLDFYLLSRGVFFDRILKILEEKAKAGLDVSLIYDGFGCAPYLPGNFSSLLRKKGIKTKVFHPLGFLSLSALNRRDHRKIAVIDRKIAYTGGVNLADEYIGEKIRFGHWKDTAIRLEGEPAERFSALFRGRTAECSSRADGKPCVVFGDDAKAGFRTGEEIYFRLIMSAKSTLFLCTPYLAPSEKLLDALKAAARCADVRILIPHIPDKRSAFALTRSYARELISAGVQVREYTAGFLHAKSLTADGNYTVMGSYNLDERSMKIQAECGVFLEDRDLASKVTGDFLSAWETGTAVPKANFKEKLCARILRPAALLF